MTRQVKRKQIIMLHCLPIPDTARTMAPSGCNCLAVSGLTTPPLKSATGAEKDAEAKCFHKARGSPTAGLLRALWRVCVYITDLILSDNAESDGIDISINFL